MNRPNVGRGFLGRRTIRTSLRRPDRGWQGPPPANNRAGCCRPPAVHWAGDNDARNDARGGRLKTRCCRRGGPWSVAQGGCYRVPVRHAGGRHGLHLPRTPQGRCCRQVELLFLAERIPGRISGLASTPARNSGASVDRNRASSRRCHAGGHHGDPTGVQRTDMNRSRLPVSGNENRRGHGLLAVLGQLVRQAADAVAPLA